MAAKKPAPEVPASAILSTLALLAHVAEPAMMAAAIPLVRERLALTPEKLADLLTRIINPDHVFGETDEAGLRRMSPTTLRGMKARKELPLVMQGTIVNSED